MARQHGERWRSRGRGGAGASRRCSCTTRSTARFDQDLPRTPTHARVPSSACCAPRAPAPAGADSFGGTPTCPSSPRFAPSWRPTAASPTAPKCLPHRPSQELRPPAFLGALVVLHLCPAGRRPSQELRRTPTGDAQELNSNYSFSCRYSMSYDITIS
jgi:hypothetical protein